VAVQASKMQASKKVLIGREVCDMALHENANQRVATEGHPYIYG